MAGTIQQRGIDEVAYAASGGMHAANGLVARGCDAYAGPDVSESMSPGARRREAFDSNPIHRRRSTMKHLVASVLLAAAFAVPASAAPSADSSAVTAIKQLGQDMGDAMVALDVERIDRMFGDDWMTIGQSGSAYTKAELLSDIKSGKKKLTWFELRPIDVQVFGDVAIAQGNVLEKRVVDGQETEMELVYQDVLKKREGRWVVVRSTGAKVK